MSEGRMSARQWHAKGNVEGRVKAHAGKLRERRCALSGSLGGARWLLQVAAQTSLASPFAVDHIVAVAHSHRGQCRQEGWPR
jgi:hypothetical protein